MNVVGQERQADMEADAAARAEYQREQAKEQPKEKAAMPLMDERGHPTPLGWRKIGELLRQEMPTKEFTAGRRGTFSYITARQVAKRLDGVVGPGNWSTEVKVIRADHPVSVLVGVAIFGVWKWDAGYSNNPEADDEQDRAYEQEPLKAAVSDGFKRAAVLWGVGRWLYGDA